MQTGSFRIPLPQNHNEGRKRQNHANCFFIARVDMNEYFKNIPAAQERKRAEKKSDTDGRVEANKIENRRNLTGSSILRVFENIRGKDRKLPHMVEIGRKIGAAGI